MIPWFSQGTASRSSALAESPAAEVEALHLAKRPRRRPSNAGPGGTAPDLPGTVVNPSKPWWKHDPKLHKHWDWRPGDGLRYWRIMAFFSRTTMTWPPVLFPPKWCGFWNCNCTNDILYSNFERRKETCLSLSLCISACIAYPPILIFNWDSCNTGIS